MTYVTPSVGSAIVAPVNVPPFSPPVGVVHVPGPVAVSTYTDNSSDSDAEFEMDSKLSSNISPSNFKGTTAENAADWLRHFENYCVYKAYDDVKTKALFRVVLTDSAAVWYDSLASTVTDDWDQTKEAFKARYTTPEFMKYQHANELFNTKQADSSVDDYCAKMQRLAREVGADETMLRFAVINGYRRR